MIRQAQPKTAPAVEAYVQLLRRLHTLIQDDKGDSDEADLLRDHMDVYWTQMEVESLELVRQLSEDLYVLNNPGETVHPLESGVYTSELASELASVHQAREYIKALRLLNARGKEVSYDRALLLRGMCYRELGLVDVSLAFLKGAANHSQFPDNANVIFLNTLWHFVDLNDAANEAKEILSRGGIYAFPLRFVMAGIFLSMAQDRSGDSRTEYGTLARDLYIGLLSELSASKGAGGQVAQCREFLSHCYYLLGETPQALEELDTALRIAPQDDGLHVQMALMSIDSDFNFAKQHLLRAVELGTVSVWPYYYLAFDSMLSGDYQRCETLSKEALNRAVDLDMQGELHAWIAMSLASQNTSFDEHLIQLIREHFATAMAFAPANQNILTNYRVFENALRHAIQHQKWIPGHPITSLRATSIAMLKRQPESIICREPTFN